jgi:wyosine [tRNA(Phe)-imidazoG37] synthetase (radical SAM superfamily)
LSAVPETLVGAAEVVREIEDWLGHGGSADYITFAGSGEPTLNIELGEMIGATRKLTDIPLAVITNGSLLLEPDVREAVSAADVLLPSLDAGTAATFEKVNRPVRGVDFVGMREGLVQTAQESANQIWLEVMLVAGVNDSETELVAIREIVRRICPDKLQINTVDRPSHSGDALPVSAEKLSEACRILGHNAEVIAGGTIATKEGRRWQQIEDELLRLLSRRPCTASDIVSVSGLNRLEVEKYLRSLVQNRLIEQTEDKDPYYRSTTGGQNA